MEQSVDDGVDLVAELLSSAWLSWGVYPGGDVEVGDEFSGGREVLSDDADEPFEFGGW